MYGLAALQQAEKNPQQALQRAQQMPAQQPGQLPPDLMRVLAAQVATQKLAEAQQQMQMGIAAPQGTVAQQVEGELQQAAQKDVAMRVAPVLQKQQQDAQQRAAGIAGLAAPNMGQQAFASGGVVGYEDGGEVEIPAVSDAPQGKTGEMYERMVLAPAGKRIETQEARLNDFLAAQRGRLPQEQGILDVLANMGPVYYANGQRISSVAGALREGVQAKDAANAARKAKMGEIDAAEFEQLGVLDKAKETRDVGAYKAGAADVQAEAAMRAQARREAQALALQARKEGHEMTKEQFKATEARALEKMRGEYRLQEQKLQNQGLAARAAAAGGGTKGELAALNARKGVLATQLQALSKDFSVAGQTEKERVQNELRNLENTIKSLAPDSAAPAAPAKAATPSTGFGQARVVPKSP